MTVYALNVNINLTNLKTNIKMKNTELFEKNTAEYFEDLLKLALYILLIIAIVLTFYLEIQPLLKAGFNILKSLLL